MLSRLVLIVKKINLKISVHQNNELLRTDKKYYPIVHSTVLYLRITSEYFSQHFFVAISLSNLNGQIHNSLLIIP